MSKPLAVFRASASPSIGGGHIVRCLALADELANQGWSCAFASGYETSKTIPSIAGRHTVFLIDESAPEKEPEIIKNLLGRSADILIVDHYHRGQAFETACRSFAKKILVIDDLPNRPHDADALLDQSGGREPEEYRGLVPDNCNFFIGPRYALLRSTFSKSPSLNPAENRSAPFRIFISMGATDESNLTEQAIRLITNNLNDSKIDILLSSNAPHLRQLETLIDKNPAISLHINIPDPADIMANANLAVGTAGINLWERCALGIPSLIVIAAENQHANAHHVADFGGGWIIGDTGTINEKAFQNSLETLTQDITALKKMSEAAQLICDGQGAKRLSGKIKSGKQI